MILLNSEKNRYHAYYLIILFVVISAFFYRSGIIKTSLFFIAYIIFIHIPGYVLLELLGYTEKTAIFLAMGVGIMNLGVFAFTLGYFEIHFKYSFILSLGIPYTLLAIKIYRAAYPNKHL